MRLVRTITLWAGVPVLLLGFGLQVLYVLGSPDQFLFDVALGGMVLIPMLVAIKIGTTRAG